MGEEGGDVCKDARQIPNKFFPKKSSRRFFLVFAPLDFTSWWHYPLTKAPKVWEAMKIGVRS
jgi:hypothetical protein